jgi:hypothetical protein
MVREKHPALSRAVWTNFTGAGATPAGAYSRELSRCWIVNGWTVIPEAYVCENNDRNLSPAVQDWTAREHLGYFDVVPSIGIYNGWKIEDYAVMLHLFPHYNVYLAEYLPEFP